MAPSHKKKAVRGWMRRIFFFMAGAALLFLVLAAVLAAAALIWRDALFRQGLGFAGERYLHARIDVEAVSGPDPLTLQGLRITGRDAEKPLLQADKLTLDWRAFPEDGRYLDTLKLGGVILNFDARHPETSSYGFLSELTGGEEAAGGESRAMAAFLPREIRAAPVQLDAAFPEGRMALENLEARAEITGMTVWEAYLSGDPARLAWRFPGGPDLPGVESRLKLELKSAGDIFSFSADADAGAALRGAASGTIRRQDGGYAVAADFSEIMIARSEVLEAVRALLPGPVRAGAVRIAEGSAAFSWDNKGFQPETFSVSAVLEGISAGPEDAPWYRGDITASLKKTEKADAPLRADITLDRDQPLRFAINSTEQTTHIEAAVPAWSRQDTASLIPESRRPWLDWLPGFQGLSADAVLDWQADSYDFEAGLELESGAGRAELGIEGGAAFSGAGETLFKGAATLSYQEGRITGDITVPDGTAVMTVWALENIAPHPWLMDWAGLDFLSGLEGRLGGEVKSNWTAEGLHLAPALELTVTAYPPLLLPEEFRVSANGAFRMPHPGAMLKGSADIDLGGAVTGTVSGLETDMKTQVLTGDLEAAAVIADLGAMAGYPDLWGELKAASPMRLAWPDLRMQKCGYSLPTLGWGDYGLPYEMPLAGTADLTWDLDDFSVSAASLSGKCGAGTKFMAEQFLLRYLLPEDKAWLETGLFNAETDFAPLVAEGFLEKAEGSARINGEKIRYQPGLFKGGMDFSADFPALNLVNQWALISGLRGDGTLARNEAFSFSGGIAADEILAAGTALKKLSAVPAAEGDKLILGDIEAHTFGGRVTGRIEWEPLAPGMPATITAALDGIDLAVFTKEIEPPSVRMTGIIGGSARLVCAIDGLRDFEADLHTLADFTLNRDMVEQIMMSQYVKTFTGGRTLDRAIQRSIGEAEQRPFKSAGLHLEYEGENITGALRMESELIGFTINIDTDPETIGEMLMLQQLERIEVREEKHRAGEKTRSTPPETVQ
jgi:hypothetical protein